MFLPFLAFVRWVVQNLNISHRPMSLSLAWSPECRLHVHINSLKCLGIQGSQIFHALKMFEYNFE